MCQVKLARKMLNVNRKGHLAFSILSLVVMEDEIQKIV